MTVAVKISARKIDPFPFALKRYVIHQLCVAAVNSVQGF